jgi:hypothetical protein
MGLTDRLSPSCSRLGQQHGRRVFPYIALSSFAETVVLRDGIGEIRWQACFSEVPENVARCRRSAAESRVSKAAILDLEHVTTVRLATLRCHGFDYGAEFRPPT